MNDSILRDVCYLDTNIFVYLHDSNAADKQRAQRSSARRFCPCAATPLNPT